MKHSVYEADFADGETDARREGNDSFKATQCLVADPGPETSLPAPTPRPPARPGHELFVTTMVWHAEDMDPECDCCPQMVKNIKENESRKTLTSWLPLCLITMHLITLLGLINVSNFVLCFYMITKQHPTECGPMGCV